MARRMFVLLFTLLGLAGQPLPAAEYGVADAAAGSGQAAGQGAADTDKTDSGKMTARPEDEEPECD